MRSSLASATLDRPVEFSRTEEVLDEFRNGRMVIIVDAEDRENEGDLVIPAQMATPDSINFMAKHGRGLICLSLTQARASQLQLDFMVRRNGSRNRTAFTQSIEAADGITTGISALDRAHTVAVAIDPTKAAGDIVSPGHVFPLIAREGGVLIRAGHTEASVDLAWLAGLLPAAVICEIMNDNGTMARVPDLLPFARRYGMKIGTIEDLIAYRLRHERLVRRVSEARVHSAHGGDFDLKVYATTVEPVEHLALVKGDLSGPEPVLVRVHAVNPIIDFLGGGLNDASEPLIGSSMDAISREGRGVIVIIRDLAPKGISDWIAKKALKGNIQAGREPRQVEIGIGSQILRDLQVSEMTLLTNSGSSGYVGLEGFGLKIVGVRPIS